MLSERDGVMGLPMIVNRKTVDPGDKASPAVFQLETAMGAAIAVFDGARALRVPRERFVPVKTTNDLLVLRSDAYVVDDDARVALAPERDGRIPLVSLDDEHFKLVRDFDAHLPAGPPSLVGCDRLTVHGDVTFGEGVVCRGTVEVEGPTRVEDGAVLEGSDGVVALGALIGLLGLREHPREQVGERDAHDDGLLEGHDQPGDVLVVERLEAPAGRAAEVVGVQGARREREHDAEQPDERSSSSAM